MNINREQMDFFYELGLKVDWRGAIYGKAKSDSETIGGIEKRTGEAETQEKVKETKRN
jgi:hypothetical protein